MDVIMPIEFRREFEFSKLLNPAKNFEESTFPIEFRIDPLTKDMGIVVEFPQGKWERPDLSRLVSQSLERGCPFCPEAIDKVTPRFPPDFCPEGRIRFNKAVVFPNAAPYISCSALTVFSSQHFIALTGFTEDMLVDAFLASQTYLKMVQEHDPGAKYCYVTWNYMPPANSSQIHPHLQVAAGHFPLAFHRNLLEAARKYHAQNGTNYSSDLVVEEKRLQERYIATLGSTIWFTSFVPRSTQLDIIAIFQGRESFLFLTPRDMRSFCQGLTNVFRYMDDKGFYSFNLCFYSGTIGEDSFWAQTRLIQRGPLGPLNISDVGYSTLLLDTKLCLRYPESVCQELRSYFS